MSTRYMRKLYGQNDQDIKGETVQSDSEEEPPKPKSFNAFSLLNQTSDDEQPEEVDEQTPDSSEPDPNETKRKKKKKRNKKTQKNKKNVDNNDIEEIVETVNEIELEPSTSKEETQTEKDWCDSCLTVQHKFLNPYNELKKIFGSKTVQAEQNRTKPRGRNTKHMRKTWLVVPKDSWMPNHKSWLSMTIDREKEAEKGVRYFKLEHSPAYKQVQIEFIRAVESFNPENLGNIVLKYGIHIDTYIQLSEYFKMSEDLPNAANLIEKALFYLECAFHPLFNMTTATCRVDYLKQQNRALFITLFKHMIFVGNKACYRTSLELCKFLLSLEPYVDPLAVVLTIDFYALRAKEFEWLVSFCKYWESARNLSQLPNMAFSLALAHFYLGNDKEADELLQYALVTFPGVLVPLMDKCSISMDSKVTGHDFFTLTADQTTPPALEKLQQLYIARCYNFWKEPEVLEWLAKQAHRVLDQSDSAEFKKKHAEIVQRRKKRYAGQLPREIARHIVLSDIPNITINSEMSQEERSMFSHDPLPPPNSIDIYNLPSPRTMQDDWQSLLLGFLESFQRRNMEANAQNPNENQHEEID